VPEIYVQGVSGQSLCWHKDRDHPKISTVIALGTSLTAGLDRVPEVKIYWKLPGSEQVSLHVN